MNFNSDADVVVGLAQQPHLLTQNSLMLGYVLARYLQTSWRDMQDKKIATKTEKRVSFLFIGTFY